MLRPSDGGADEALRFRLTLPAWARRGGVVEVTGAPLWGPPICFSPECGESSVGSFDRLLRVLRRHRTNNVISATLRLGPALRVRDRDRAVLERVVRGSTSICVRVGSERCEPYYGEGEPFFRPVE